MVIEIKKNEKKTENKEKTPRKSTGRNTKKTTVKQNIKKMETSKKILWLSYIIGGILTLLVIICSFLNIECTNITTLAGAAWLEISASNVFYYTMNKRLNAPKIVIGLYNDLPNDLKQQVDINNLFSNLMN